MTTSNTSGQSFTGQTNHLSFDGDGFNPNMPITPNLPIWDAPQPTYIPTFIPNLLPVNPQPFQWYNPNYTVPTDNPTFESTLLGRKVKTKPGENLFETGTIMGVIVNSSYGIVVVSVIVYSTDNIFYTSLLSTLSLEESI